MEIVLPKLTDYQQKVFDWLADPYQTGKVSVIKSVRQSGKSFFCMVELICMALNHPRTTSAVIEPTLEQSRIIYKSITKALENTSLIKNANAQTLNIEFNNGSTIVLRSTQQGDANRGYTVTGLLILDECAYLDNEAIFTILPLVNAHNAPIIICSTPFTQEGYFYDMFLIGTEPNSKNVTTFDWSHEKGIERFLTPERKEFYKQTMSRAKYTTEIMGEFLTDEGLLFQNIEKCILDNPPSPTFLNLGIDFATGSDGDYTVLTAVDNNGNMYKMFRTNNLSPMQQVDWLVGLVNELSTTCTIKKILAEKNSIGSVYIDAMNGKLIQRGLTITDWTTTNKSKQDLVTTLQIALENEDVHILRNDILLNELKRYQADINPRTHSVTYNGKGAHDDTVISLMLAYFAYKSSYGHYTLSFNAGKSITIR